MLEHDSAQSITCSVRIPSLELRISSNLASMQTLERGDNLEGRLHAFRSDVATKQGFVIPTIRTTDDAALSPNTYRILVNNIEVASGSAYVDQEFVVGPGIDRIQDVDASEPTFALQAGWIPVEARERAIALLGITPLPAISAIITHLAEIVGEHAADLLSPQQVEQMLGDLKASDPAVVEEMKLAQLSLMDLQRVLAALLADKIPILDLVRITEAVTARCRQPGKSHECLVEAARAAVGPSIAAAHMSEGRLSVVTLDPATEHYLSGRLTTTDAGTILAVAARICEQLTREMREFIDVATREGKEAVLLVSPRLRPALARILSVSRPRVAVLAVTEIYRGLRLERVGVIGGIPPVADLRR